MTLSLAASATEQLRSNLSRDCSLNNCRNFDFWMVLFQISGDLDHSLVGETWRHYCGSTVILLEISKWPSFACLGTPVLVAFFQHKNQLALKKDAKSCLRTWNEISS